MACAREPREEIGLSLCRGARPKRSGLDAQRPPPAASSAAQVLQCCAPLRESALRQWWDRRRVGERGRIGAAWLGDRKTILSLTAGSTPAAVVTGSEIANDLPCAAAQLVRHFQGLADCSMVSLWQ
jgi:hypothetical protein